MTKHQYTFIVPSLATAMPTDLFPIALFFFQGEGVQLLYSVVLFLLYSEVNQLYVYISFSCPPHPTHLGHHRAPIRAPCSFPLAIDSTHSSVYTSIPISKFIPLPFLPNPVSTCVCSPHLCLYSALQIGSSVPFFQIAHITQPLKGTKLGLLQRCEWTQNLSYRMTIFQMLHFSQKTSSKSEFPLKVACYILFFSVSIVT